MFDQARRSGSAALTQAKQAAAPISASRRQKIWERIQKLGFRSMPRNSRAFAEQVDAENPAMTPQLTIDILWRRVSDPGR